MSKSVVLRLVAQSLSAIAALLACADIALAQTAPKPAADATLRSTPDTVVWGYFAAGIAPALRIKSGQTVRIDTVSHDLQWITEARTLQGILDHERILLRVLDQQNERRLRLHDGESGASGMVKKKVAPCPGSDSTQMRPP